MKKEKKEVKRGLVESASARGPCPECGTLALNIWKGGGFNVSSTQAQNTSQENYIKSLQQQIKILELEIIFLKNQISGEGGRDGNQEIVPREDVQQEIVYKHDEEDRTNKDIINKLRSELQAGFVKIEESKIEKSKLESRIKNIEQYRCDEKNKYIEKISRLTGRVEYLEAENKNKAEENSVILMDLEKQAITSKDRERRIQELNEELERGKEEVESSNQKLEASRLELVSKQSAINQLQDKFLGSSPHVSQETIRNLEIELKSVLQKNKEMQLEQQEWIQTRDRAELVRVKLVEENSELRTEIARITAALTSEVRIRESKETKMSLEGQELSLSRERESNLRSEVSRLQILYEKQSARLKEAQERLTGEGHTAISQELRIATQKSRIAELEGMLNLATENTNNIRRQNMSHLEKEEQLRRDIELGDKEIGLLTSELAQTQSKMLRAQKKIDELMLQQRDRWEQFCRMADSMKNLSSDMLERGQANRTDTNPVL